MIKEGNRRHKQQMNKVFGEEKNDVTTYNIGMMETTVNLLKIHQKGRITK